MVSAQELLKLDLGLSPGQGYARILRWAVVAIVVEDGSLCERATSAAARCEGVPFWISSCKQSHHQSPPSVPQRRVNGSGC